MAWIESHIGLDKHPKTLNLACVMNWSVRETVGALHIFWHWCVDYAEDGNLTRYNDSTLASVVGLDPQAGREFVEAMVKCGGETASGFIEREPYFRVHDWWNYFGKYLQVKYKHNPKKWKGIQKGYVNGSKGGSNNRTYGRSRSRSPILKLKGGLGENNGFDEFWSAFPRHVAKSKALESWSKLDPDPSLKIKILEAIEKQKEWPQWTKEKGQYIPYPATWLNQHRWEDETPVEPQQGQFSKRITETLTRGLDDEENV